MQCLRWLLVICLAIATAACATPDILPRGEQAYDLMPTPEMTTATADYRISPLDTLSITVFQEPDLSLKDVVVETSGTLLLPLLGKTQVAGLTTSELAADLESKYGARYVRRPQISITITNPVSQQVTVEGNVIQPGIYPVSGRMTLLRALASARGPTRVAALDEVVVFRVINGQRMGALFDVNAIRKGRAPDPQIMGNDMVVVGFNAVKGAYRDFLQTAPVFAIFRNF